MEDGTSVFFNVSGTRMLSPCHVRVQDVLVHFKKMLLDAMRNVLSPVL